MDVIAVPASEIVEEWYAELRVRATLTEPEWVARKRDQRRAREREISQAIGRPYRIEEDC